ncbi:MAG TPA: homoserine kinase [Microbacteriaceae bacterium]|nr:homoserine kinase [Microbacteriaceae bacterium]
MTDNESGRTLRVRVPATSANLGPGFDTMGIALSLGNDLWVTETTSSGVTISVEGVGSGDVPTDDTNLIVKAIQHVYEKVGKKMPGLMLRAVNRIPHGRGMGSSGSAIVAGVMAAKGLLEGEVDLSEDELLGFATDLEGHPDNVAPALFGGLTIAWTTPNGPRSKRLSVHRGVSPLVIVPEFTMSTELARSLQPAHVPTEDAIFNLSRSALLVAALTQSPELLEQATEDRLHQDYRAEAMPTTRNLISALRENGHAAVVSGAGPAVLVLANGPKERLEAAAIAESYEPNWERMLLAVDILGATVEEVSL